MVGCSMEAPDWSNMPIDVLYEIFKKIGSIEDFMAFSAVCHSWHHVYKHAKSGRSQGMPWLMLAENSNNNPDNLRKFFDPSTNKCYQLRFPKSFTCWGSAYGWIVVLNLDFEIFLFNPLTGAQVKLPSACTLPKPLHPEWIDRDDPQDILLVCRCILDRVVLLKIPEWGDDDLLAVSTSGDMVHVGIAKPNDSIWTPVSAPGNKIRRVVDVAYKNGALFMIDDMGEISYAELGDGVMNQKPLTSRYYSPPFKNYYSTSNRLYMIELSGELLVILRVRPFIGDAHDQFEAEDPIYKTQAFKFFKYSKETKVWKSVKGVGESSIFVGENATMLIKACEQVNCRRNCIYFTDDFWGMWSHPKEFGGHDMGIFNIDVNFGKDRFSTILEPLYEGQDSRARFSCPLWFVPRL